MLKESGRLLFIFTAKSLLYTAVFGVIGILLFTLIGGIPGIVVALVIAAIGFGIGTLKMPDTNSFEITRKTGGENLDTILIRLIKFKLRGKRIYVYTKEENK